MLAYLLSGVAFATAVVAGAPRWSWFVLAALTGASGPNIGSLVRARWAEALDEPGRRQTAFAFEAVVDEVVFVVGPPLVTLLATLIAPPVGFLTGIVLGAVGGFWLAGQRTTEPPVQAVDPAAPARRWTALNATVLVVAGTYLAVGVRLRGHGRRGRRLHRRRGRPRVRGPRAGGLRRRQPGRRAWSTAWPGCPARWPAASSAARCSSALAAQLLCAVGSLAVLVPVALPRRPDDRAGARVGHLAGGGAGAARSALTEALSWTTTGLTLGVTAGSALAGWAVDHVGARAAFAVPALAAALAAVLALCGPPLLRRAARGPSGARAPGPPCPSRVILSR